MNTNINFTIMIKTLTSKLFLHLAACLLWSMSCFVVNQLNAQTDPAAYKKDLSRNTSAIAVPAQIKQTDLPTVIYLNAGPIDVTTAQAQRLQQNVPYFEGKKMHLIKFEGPIKPEWHDLLTNAGLAIVDYIPNYTYLVFGDFAAIRAVQSVEAREKSPIVWAGEYLPSYKIMPEVYQVNPGGEVNREVISSDQFQVQLFLDNTVNGQTRDLMKSKGTILDDQGISHYVNIVVELAPADMIALSARPDVISIYPYVAPTKNDEAQNMIMTGQLIGNGPAPGNYLTWLANKGFTQGQFNASGFVVNVSDDGLDNGSVGGVLNTTRHFGLYTSGDVGLLSRVAFIKKQGNATDNDTRGCDGHGTINSHIIGGYVPDNLLTNSNHTDANGFRYGLGIAPFVKVGNSTIFKIGGIYSNPNLANLESESYNNGGRISSNSWGSASGGAYTSSAQAYDFLVRDAQPSGSLFPSAGNQEMVIFFSAGNSGSGANTIGAPGTGKNVITVGATENVRAFGGSDGCGINDASANSANDMIGFSSRGPCDDGRIKPDIVAPGTHITGGTYQSATVNPPLVGGPGAADACFNGGGVCGGVGSNFFPGSQQWTTASSGTSHSCPALAGFGALIRQDFINRTGTAPSPAMTKAAILNSAAYMNGAGANDNLFSNNQGMGRVHMDNYFNAMDNPKIIRDQLAADMFSASGQEFSRSGFVANTGLPVRVTLAYTDAPGPTSGNAFVNNLDLEVTVNGVVYLGNVFTGALSSSGGIADNKNNVESVFLPAGASGPITVKVKATNIAGDGVPNFGVALDQDFAIIITNVSETPPLCGDPSNLTNSLITNTTATISWTTVPVALSYDVDYKRASDTSWTAAASATMDTSLNLTGLSINTQYQWRVRATCPAGSGYYASFGFTTLTQVIAASGSTVIAGSNCGISTLDPQETITVNLGLINTGTFNSGAVTATLLATGGVVSPSAPQNYGVLTNGGPAVSRPFTFTLNKLCGDTVTATLSVTDGVYSTSVSFKFLLGSTSVVTLFSENFDGITAPGLPANWTTAQTGATPPPIFATTAATANSAPNAVFTNGSTTVSTNSLISPVLSIPTIGTKTITFAHTLSFEDATTRYDGAVLEISLDGGTTFVDITDPSIGGSFVANGYTATINAGFSNPLAGRQSWGGTQPSYSTVTVSLPSGFGGSNIKLRWRAGFDSTVSGSNPNWRIDDITVAQNVPVCTTCPEIEIAGNTATIADGDIMPSLVDHTDFGDVNTGTNLVRTYTVKNTGTAILTINSIVVSGTDMGLFTVGALTPAGPIPPADSATFSVTFAPLTTGLKTATIAVDNDDADESVYDFAIQGTGGVPCSLTLSSPSGSDAQNVCMCTAITNITYSTVGATGATFSGLPAGVSGTWATNNVTISGTPSGSGSFNYTVTLTGGGCSNTATGTITVETAALPTMTAPGPITIACGSSPSSSMIPFSNAFSGGCLISGTSNSSTFSAQTPAGACGGTITETWTGTDICGRTLTSVSRFITVSPAALPTITAPSNITVTCSNLLPSASTRSFSNGQGGNCQINGTSNLSTFATIISGNCNGQVLETWTANDICGRTLVSVSRTIFVKDTVKPTASCKNISLNLGSAGTVSTNAAAVNNNSADNCGIVSLSLSQTTFTCANFGANMVTLTATDNCMNAASCTATITIGYSSAPVAKCKNAIVVLSSAGNGSISVAGINNASTDLCASSLTLALSKTTFNCSNLGPNVVTLTVTNVAGNSSTCTGTVTVKDLAKPVARCQAVAINVPAGTTVTVPASAVNNGSTDACTSPPNLSLSRSQFTCANVGPNTVTLSATDASNNTGTCTAIVTVTCSGGSINIENGSTEAEAKLSELLDLMPNPATEQVIVRLNDDALVDRRISVVDYTGKLVLVKVVPAGDRQLSIDLSASDFATGVYMVSVQFKGSVQTKPLVVFR